MLPQIEKQTVATTAFVVECVQHRGSVSGAVLTHAW
jgi:hypothetical protein